MNEILQEARTVAVKSCSKCSAGLLERDKYCRWCGVRQPGAESLALHRAHGTSIEDHASRLGSAPTVAITTAITADARTDVYRRVSGPLVNAVVTGALSTPSSENHSAFIKRVILALISIPIWLIIVLLSPLDAYAAVKNLAR